MIMTVWRRASARRRLAIVLLLGWLLFGVIGYLVLSPWLRSTLVNTLVTRTGQAVQLDKLVFNPFTLSLSLRQFAIGDGSAEPLLAFEELYINFQLSSVLRRSWHFDRILLQAPRGRLVQRADGSLNVAALLAAFSTESAAEENSAPGALPRLSFRQLALVDGDFRYRDEARAEPDELALTPLTFEVRDFSTHADGEGNNQFSFAVTGPQGGELDWQGSVALSPLHAAGRIALSGVSLAPFADFFQHYLRFTVPEAMLDIASDYQLEMQGDGVLRLAGGTVTLSNVAIRDPALDMPVLSLSRLRLGDISLDSTTQSLRVGQCDLDGVQVTLKLQQDGLHLLNLLTPTQPQPVVASADADARTPSSEEMVVGLDTPAPVSSWQWQLGKLALNAASITVIDETRAAPVQIRLAPVNLQVDGLASQPGEAFTFSADLAVAERGDVVLSGTGQLTPLAVSAEIAGRDIALSAFQGWVQQQAALQLQRGQLDTVLSARVDTLDGGAIGVDMTGAATLSDLALLEADGSPLLAWQRLSVAGLSLSSTARALTLAEVELVQPRLQSLVDVSGRDPAARILATGTPAAAGAAVPWHIRLGQLRWQDGELQHRDRSLATPFQISLNRLRGEWRDLDSARPDSGQLSLQADVNGVTPLAISGAFNPLSSTPDMALQFSLAGYDMAGLAPYTGEFLGYGVASGQLDVQAEMALAGTLLDSNSLVKATNFFLGEQVDSEQAIRAPVKLGLAVLRDRSGVISLPIKASGDLSDPSVSVSGIILQALRNVMVKAATSPFSALASLAGGKEINQVAFQPGSATLADEGEQQLAQVAAMLTDRPSLLLELSGAVADNDRLPLARQILGAELLGGAWPGLPGALQDREFRRAVQRRYQQQFAMSATTLVGDQLIEPREARERVISERAFMALAEQAVGGLPDNRLRELADLRAQRGKALLVQQFTLAAERVSIVPPNLNAASPGVLLGLGAR